MPETNCGLTEDDETGGDNSHLFERAIFELAIGALPFLIICYDKEYVDISITENLLEVFMLLSYSPLYAAHRFYPILESIGVLDSSEVKHKTIKTVANVFNNQSGGGIHNPE